MHCIVKAGAEILTPTPRSGPPRPSFKTEKASGDNKEVNKWINKYLGVGEWVMDQGVAIASSSSWFERSR